MTKKKLPATIEECKTEIEQTEKQLRQYENKGKILDRKLAIEKRKERNHRLCVRGAVFESIVPEAKNMTDEEAAELLRLALTSEPVREYLKKRAESGNAGRAATG